MPVDSAKAFDTELDSALHDFRDAYDYAVATGAPSNSSHPATPGGTTGDLSPVVAGFRQLGDADPLIHGLSLGVKFTDAFDSQSESRARAEIQTEIDHVQNLLRTWRGAASTEFLNYVASLNTAMFYQDAIVTSLRQVAWFLDELIVAARSDVLRILESGTKRLYECARNDGELGTGAKIAGAVLVAALAIGATIASGGSAAVIGLSIASTTLSTATTIGGELATVEKEAGQKGPDGQTTGIEIDINGKDAPAIRTATIDAIGKLQQLIQAKTAYMIQALKNLQHGMEKGFTDPRARRPSDPTAAPVRVRDFLPRRPDVSGKELPPRGDFEPDD